MHTAKQKRSENAPSGRLQEVKNNGKSSTVRPKKCSRSLTGGRLLAVPTVMLRLGKFWCFGGGVKGGGRLPEVVAYGRSTVLKLLYDSAAFWSFYYLVWFSLCSGLFNESEDNAVVKNLQLIPPFLSSSNAFPRKLKKFILTCDTMHHRIFQLV